jgi:threonine dehydratase
MKGPYPIQIQTLVKPTTLISAPRLVSYLGIDVVLASETFQCTGSFKFRAASHVASSVPQQLLITASSGNFGQALAYACSLLSKSSIIVMPATSAKVKVDAVREFGGQVEFVDTRTKSRAERVNEIAELHPEAYIASAYDDPLVIAGNSSLGREIAAFPNPLDIVVAPIGGGGLISGIIKGIKQAESRIQVVGAEPLAGNDAARSLQAGVIIQNRTEPATIADGARTISLGRYNWEIIGTSLRKIVEVPEANIRKAVRLLFELANLKVEPTGALSLAAVMSQPELFHGRSVCCVVSGGNVDPSVYLDIMQSETQKLGESS